MTAAGSLLSLAAVACRYSTHVDAPVRASMLDMLERLHAVGDIDLKQPITEGVKEGLENATFPVAVLGIGNVGLDFFVRMSELDPYCLASSSRGKPAFIDAINFHIQKDSNSSAGSAHLNERIDDILAFWAQSVPLDHITRLDKPGDDPGAGILGHIRNVGAFPQLQRTLTSLGFDANAKSSGSFPTASSITSIQQFHAFMENGGDLRQIVPVQWPHRPDGVELWEYIFESQNNTGGRLDLLQAIGSWCKDQGQEIDDQYTEKMYWWHLRHKAASNKSSLLEFLTEHGNWAERRDQFGRNTLHIAGQLCPSFLNHVLSTKTLLHLLDEKDMMGHGAAAHLLPTLASYNRVSDAKTMAGKLMRRRGRLRDFDENNECGLVISFALDLSNHGMTTLPSPFPLYKSGIREYTASMSQMWLATPEQYEQVATTMIDNLFSKPIGRMSAVSECTSRLLFDACAAIALPVPSFSNRSEDDPKREALQIFNMMPRRLQQAIILDAVKVPEFAKKPAAGMGNNIEPVNIALENPRISAWIQTALGDLEIEIPPSYMDKQQERLGKWIEGNTSKKAQPLGDVLKVLHAVVQANALRAGIDAAQANEKGQDREQSRPSPRL